MSRPITWQSLSNHNLPDPTRLIAMGQEGLNAGMSGFQKMTDNYLQGQQNIVDKSKVDNKEAFLSTLYGIKTPEAMAAMERSGQLDAQLAGYGDKVLDRPALLQAMQGRMGALQKQTTDGMVYSDTLQDRKNDPILQEYRLASPARQAEIVAQNPSMRGLGAVVQDTQKFGFEKAKADQAAALAPITRNQLTAQINESNARTANIPVEQARLEQTANLAAIDRLGVMRERAREDLGKTSKSWIGSDDGQKHLADGLIKGTQDKVTAQAVSQQINGLVGNNPKYAELPAATVLQIALGNMKGIGTGNWWDSNNTSSMKKSLDAALDNSKTSKDEVAAKRADITSQIEQIKGQIDSAERKAFPEFAKQIDAAKAKAANGGGGADKANYTDEAMEAEILARGAYEKPPTEGSVDMYALPKGTKPTAKVAKDVLIQQQASVEKAEMNLGIIKKHSPEVRAYLDNQTTQEKKADAAKALKKELYNNGYTAAPMGMVYTNEDIQGPLAAAKQHRAVFEKMVEDAKNGR